MQGTGPGWQGISESIGEFGVARVVKAGGEPPIPIQPSGPPGPNSKYGGIAMARTVAGGAAPGRMNRRFLLVAVLLAVLSAVLVYAKISATKRLVVEARAAAGDTDGRRREAPIEQRTLLTADHARAEERARRTRCCRARIASIADAVGKVTKYPIRRTAGDRRATSSTRAKPATDARCRSSCPTGKRAMSISASR